jgi:hypothetical protein
MKDTKFVTDLVVEVPNKEMNRTQKVLESLDQLCMAFDIQKPMWFDKNTKEMKFFAKTSFHEDQFIETIDFDYFEIEIIEEDTH